jgi:predicted ABC-class ATPase
MGLPAFGRRIAGRHAEAMFFEELPRIVGAALFFENLDSSRLYRHVETSEDADFLREKLDELELVAFVKDGAVLPRASGIDPRPMTQGQVVKFESPESFRVEVELPNSGPITGMGIPQGVTLIVGGGYHGKSTLLNALEMGVYNHIPGDGREFVVTNSHAVKIRAEDGRRIEKVDISPFIADLPFGKGTREFSTDDASGSTSQAANTMESLEAGAKVLLIDEDTSATNFMIRDHRMQELVSKDKESITPFIDKVRQLYHDLNVSTILVIGGSGEYFDVADHVICMVEYKPHDMTDEARTIAEKYKAERKSEGGESFGAMTPRIPQAESFDPQKGKKAVKISAKGLKSILFGIHHIDLTAVEQLIDRSQTNAIGDAIHYATRYMDGKRTLREVIDLVIEDIHSKGLDTLQSRLAGNYAEFRRFELAAAINRLRTLRVR